MLSNFFRFEKLSYKLDHLDEPWIYTEEPHSSRRREILKKYPELKKLMGYDSSIAYIVVFEVILQLVLCYLLREASWTTIFILGYIISGTLNHSLGSAIHEIGHNLAFGHSRPLWNRALGMVCNLPMAIPMSVTYKIYHSDHHRYLGHDTMDVDIPSVLEAKLFRHPLTKILWLFLHPAIHGIRPFMKSPKTPSGLEIINIVLQLSFDYLIYSLWGHKALAYLALGTILGLGCHPTSGHFISEHYLFWKGQATMSYYGPLNPILFNVGYHVEHHDFPYIPHRRLPEVRRIAAEFYEDLPYHTSWIKVLWDFVFDPEMGPHARGVGYLQEGEGKPCCIASANATKSTSTNGTVPDDKVDTTHTETTSANQSTDSALQPSKKNM